VLIGSAGLGMRVKLIFWSAATMNTAEAACTLMPTAVASSVCAGSLVPSMSDDAIVDKRSPTMARAEHQLGGQAARDGVVRVGGRALQH
jgi:hypothetical protein